MKECPIVVMDGYKGASALPPHQHVVFNQLGYGLTDSALTDIQLLRKLYLTWNDSAGRPFPLVTLATSMDLIWLYSGMDPFAIESTKTGCLLCIGAAAKTDLRCSILGLI